MAVPAKFRGKLQKGAVVTKGLDNCLVIYPRAEWEQLAQKLSSLPISQSNTRAFSSLLFKNVTRAPSGENCNPLGTEPFKLPFSVISLMVSPPSAYAADAPINNDNMTAFTIDFLADIICSLIQIILCGRMLAMMNSQIHLNHSIFMKIVRWPISRVLSNG